jgi:hypothetical protein
MAAQLALAANREWIAREPQGPRVQQTAVQGPPYLSSVSWPQHVIHRYIDK